MKLKKKINMKKNKPGCADKKNKKIAQLRAV